MECESTQRQSGRGRGTGAQNAAIRREKQCPNWQQTAYPASVTAATTAASGRYIRCSAMTCVATGTTLDVGARMAKKPRPQKAESRPPPEGHERGQSQQRHQHRVGQNCGRHGDGGPAVVEQQGVRPETELQVVNDRPELGAKIGPTAGPGSKAGRAAAAARAITKPPQQTATCRPRPDRGRSAAARPAPNEPVRNARSYSRTINGPRP